MKLQTTPNWKRHLSNFNALVNDLQVAGKMTVGYQRPLIAIYNKLVKLAATEK